MADIRLGKLPDRTAVKLSIGLAPDLHQQLLDYSAFYEEAYGQAEAIADLIPAMLAAFLNSDRGFANRRKRKCS